MEKQMRKRKRLTAFFLAVVLTVGNGVQAFALSGEVINRKQATVVAGSTNWSFELKDEGGYTYDATCVEPDNGVIPSIGESTSMTEVDRSSRVAKIAYLGAQESTGDVQMYIISRAAARARGEIGANCYSYINEVNALYDAAGDMSEDVPKNFVVYLAEPSGGGQTMLAWRTVGTGLLKLQKHSANPTLNLSLAGAKYGVYTTKSAADETDWDFRAGTLITDEDGFDQMEVLPGTYYVKETEAPEGFLLDPVVYSVSISEDEWKTVYSEEEPALGYLKLEKKSEEKTNLSLAGAKYGVYTTWDAAEKTSETSRAGVLVTDKNGHDQMELSPGTYYVKEFQAPEGFEIDNHIYKVTVEPSETTKVTSVETLSKGSVRVKKVPSENKHLVEICPQQYTLKGAEYCIYETETGAEYQDASQRVATLTTDSEGYSNEVALPIGTYYAKETKRPKGYQLDHKVHKIIVSRNKTTTFTSKEKPLFDPLTIILSKRDKGGNGEAPSLAGGEFTVKYYKEISDDVSGHTAVRTWKFKTNAAGAAIFHDNYKIGGDELFKDDNGQPVGLIGTYTIQETKAPKGYVKDDKIYYAHVIESGTTNPETVYNKPEVPNERKEFRLKLTKKDEEAGGTAQGDASLSGAVFGLYRNGNLMKKYTTGENGTFTTEYHTLGDGSHTYTVKEITPPEGYLKSNSTYTLKGLEEENISVQHTTINQTVNNTVIKGKIALNKVYDANDDTGTLKPEEGIRFQIYLKSAGSYSKADSDEKETITTDRYGFAQTKELPYGLYTIHQVNTADGHDKVDDFDVFIKEDGAIYRYTLNNGVPKAEIRVEKVDAETGKKIPAVGTTFKIWNVAKSEWVSFEVKYPNPHTIDTFQTDATGTFQLPDKLDYGQYQLEEVVAPEGYVVAKERVTFHVDGTSKLITVKAENMPQKGNVEIFKSGEVLKSIIANEDGTYTPVYGEGFLKDAVFEIRAAEDIITPDHTLRFEKGQLVDTVMTNGEGKAVSKNLYLGKYEVQEKTAPVNHVLNSEVYTAELTYAGQDVALTMDALSIEDERQRAVVSLKKFMETEVRYGYGADKSKDILFGIYADEVITAEDSTIIPADGLIESIGVEAGEENYSGTFAVDLPHGNFYVKEIKGPEGYVTNDTKYPVDFTYKNQNESVIEIIVNDGNTILNEIIRGSIHGHKKDEAGDSLAGAKMGLFVENESIFTDETALQTDVSDIFGQFEFEEVPYGNYVVREIEAPAGFAKNQTSHKVKISEETETVEVEVINEITKFDITKTDIVTGEPVIGAELCVIPLDDEGNPDVGATFETWITEEKAHRVQGLEVGKTYILRERLTGLAWDCGYVTAEEIRFTVEDTGEVQKLEMKDDHTKVEISKVDKDTGSFLAGATLQILHLNGDLVMEFVSGEEPHLVEYLPVGTYILHEKEVPAGYVAAEDLVFEVKDTPVLQKVVMADAKVPEPESESEDVITPETKPTSKPKPNVKPKPISKPKPIVEAEAESKEKEERKEKTDIPKSGDTESPGLWISILIASAGTFTTLVKRKKQSSI